MNTPDISHLEPWLEHLRMDHHKRWFREVFSRILSFGYVPHEESASDIIDGISLRWKSGDTYILAARHLEFNGSGSLSGITLEHEGENYELQLSVNTPLEVVHAAIKHLNPDHE